jgi:hypothetical protein
MPADKRRATRYQVALPVQLESGNGSTRDISTSGIFFETEESFSPGAEIRFSAVLEHAVPGGPVRLRCEGQIVRVERREGKVGVAATITSYQFEPLEPHDTTSAGK